MKRPNGGLSPGKCETQPTLTHVQEHPPARPSWDCQTCGKPWPCNTARDLLISEMDRVALSVYMWLNLENAVTELAAMPAAELFDRFISWTH